ncbi:type III-A CRISPR-associated protein Cas10/Csm1 [Persephonella sp.]
MENKKIKYLIALAGLFHDIGKFYQRATKERTTEEEKKEFGYAHAALSARAIKEELNESLTAIFSPEEIGFILEGTYHHNPQDTVQHLIQKADWVSSSEREKAEAEYSIYMEEFADEIKKLSESYLRLRSIFEKLSLSNKRKKIGFVHKIIPLDLSEDIFPKDLENDIYIEIVSQGRKAEDILGSYKKQWEEFRKEFNEKLKNLNLKFEEHPEKIFSAIYHLLYKYLWCIPASTYDKENYSNHYPDISLFDHSRVLSAVACCFYDYDEYGFQQKTIEKFDKELKDKKVFLHLKADISGIQKFIYKVHTGKGGVAKTLRGRSFYVSLLPEILSRYILNKLNYPISNLLYCGGGIFEILVANTEQNKNKIKDIIKEIEKFLAKRFEADLGIAFGLHEYSPIQMMEDYKTVLRKLNESLDNAKRRKFQNLIETGEIFELLNSHSSQIEEKKKCPVCQTYMIDEKLEENYELCELCKTFRDIGEFLPKTEKIVFAKDWIENFKGDKKVIDFENFGKVYLILKNEKKKKIDLIYFNEETTEILNLNDTNLVGKTTGFKFLGNTVPKALRNLGPEETEEDEVINEGQIAPFTIVAKHSEGDKRIGILRMDVDNLGKLFTKGIQNISISRVATLSRMIDLFFAGYLNTICKNLSENLSKENNKNRDIDNLFYILYSGGDDLFIVAPWDKAIELACKINEQFDKYTCFNPDITLSAGYIQTKPKFPIKVSAEIAGETEELAKNKDKNKICVLGDILEWEELKEIKEQAEKIKKFIETKQLQRGFIYAVHRLKEQFLKKEDENSRLVFLYKDHPDSMFYPYVHYYIARNIEKENIKEEIAKMLLNTENIKNLKRLTFLINYVALKTRN